MMPSLVVSAQDEWILVPTKYRLSNTLPGSVYQVARSGGGDGATSGPAAVCGSTHNRASVPVKSNCAAALAAARKASVGLVGCWAEAGAVPNAAAAAMAIRRGRFMQILPEFIACAFVARIERSEIRVSCPAFRHSAS